MNAAGSGCGRGFIDFGAMQQSLGRNASPVKAGTPQFAGFDKSRFFSVLGTTDGGFISAWAAAHHHYFEFHFISFNA